MKKSPAVTIALLLSSLCFCGLLGAWPYSEKNLANFASELERIETEYLSNGITDELEAALAGLNRYDFRKWRESDSATKNRIREVISEHNEMLIAIYVSDDLRSGVGRNVAYRLLCSTKPSTLSQNHLKRLIEDGITKNLGAIQITRFLDRYEGFVESTLNQIFEESQEEHLGLAVHFGLEAAAPLMREFASRPFERDSVIREISKVHTLDKEGNVIERMEIVYAYKKNGSAESIRRASLWLLNSDGVYPDIQKHLKNRLKEIESVLPEEAMPQLRGTIKGAIRKSY